jgi:hypothetical protein
LLKIRNAVRRGEPGGVDRRAVAGAAVEDDGAGRRVELPHFVDRAIARAGDALARMLVRAADVDQQMKIPVSLVG